MGGSQVVVLNLLITNVFAQVQFRTQWEACINICTGSQWKRQTWSSTVARLSWRAIRVSVLWNGIDVWTPSSELQTKGAMASCIKKEPAERSVLPFGPTHQRLPAIFKIFPQPTTASKSWGSMQTHKVGRHRCNYGHAAVFYSVLVSGCKSLQLWSVTFEENYTYFQMIMMKGRNVVLTEK